MHSPHDLLSRMLGFCDFLAELGDVGAEVLLSPMAEGKWSVQETIAHIMIYDESFLRTVVLPIHAGKRPHLADPQANQAFNEKAAARGRKLTKARLLGRAARARRKLVDHLRRLPAEAFRTKLQGAPGDLADLLDEDFVTHDRNHVERMRAFLQGRGP